MSHHHDIFLVNFKTGDVISHEIFLIKGSVTKRCSGVISITLKNLKNNSIVTEKLSLKSDFKFLTQLTLGKNQFEITFCEKSLEFYIDYVPIISKYNFQPLYIVCENHDGCFNALPDCENNAVEASKKIILNLKLIQCLYAEKLLESGFERKTFSLKKDCIIFQSKLKVEKVLQLNENSLWNEFAYEIINSKYGSDSNLKFIAFIGCTKYFGSEILNDYSYENIKKHTKGHAALGGGGLALFGSGCFYSWPSYFHEIQKCFGNLEKINLQLYLDESNYRRTLGGCYATSLGAVCHEIGHSLDLGHSNDGIMGNGFDYMNHVFTTEILTENLPSRVVANEIDENLSQQDTRLTKIKKSNAFLERYHEQQTGDSTYFTRNCAIILNYHKWLNLYNSNDDCTVTFENNSIISQSYLILIEIREKCNGLVLKYFDFIDKNIKMFELPKSCYQAEKHNIFVITIFGTIKIFE